MQYLLLFNSPAEDLEREQDDPDSQTYWESWRLYIGACHAAGIVRGGNGLGPPATATTVRIRDDERHVQDGPFADTKELLGGYLVIEVPTLDEAIGWAARSPSSGSGSTEVRPVLTLNG